MTLLRWALRPLVRLGQLIDRIDAEATDRREKAQ